MVRVFDHANELRLALLGPKEVFVYRDHPETRVGDLKWCVAETRANGEEIEVRDLGAFYHKDNAVLFAVAYANPSLLRPRT